MTHTFDSEVSSHYWMLWPTVGHTVGIQGTHMDTLKPKNSKLITFTVREGFFTFWAILAHSVPFGF